METEQSRVSCLSDITDRLNAFQNLGSGAGAGRLVLIWPSCTSPPSLAAGKLGGETTPTRSAGGGDHGHTQLCRSWHGRAEKAGAPHGAAGAGPVCPGPGGGSLGSSQVNQSGSPSSSSQPNPKVSPLNNYVHTHTSLSLSHEGPIMALESRFQLPFWRFTAWDQTSL